MPVISPKQQHLNSISLYLMITKRVQATSTSCSISKQITKTNFHTFVINFNVVILTSMIIINVFSWCSATF